MKHFRMINDLSCQMSSFQITSSFRCIRLFSRIFKFQKMEQNSLLCFCNAIIQCILIIVLLFSTSVEIVFPVSTDFIEQFLLWRLLPLCLLLFPIDFLMILNTNFLKETDQTKIESSPSQVNITSLKVRYFFLIDFVILSILITETQLSYEQQIKYGFLVVKLLFFLKLHAFYRHSMIIKKYLLPFSTLTIAYSLIKVFLFLLSSAHALALSWYALAKYNLSDQSHTWILQVHHFIFKIFALNLFTKTMKR